MKDGTELGTCGQKQWAERVEGLEDLERSVRLANTGRAT